MNLDNLKRVLIHEIEHLVAYELNLRLFNYGLGTADIYCGA